MDSNVINFLTFLYNNRLIDILRIKDDNSIGFNNRFRLQKLIFLAQSRFNLPQSYYYSIWKHGPYSRQLAQEVYDLDIMNFIQLSHLKSLIEKIENKGSYQLPKEFDENRFISLFRDKENDWLEITTTLIQIYDKMFQKRKIILAYAKSIKPHYDYEYIEQVFNKLAREKLILTIKEDLENIRNRAPDFLDALANDDKSLIKN